MGACVALARRWSRLQGETDTGEKETLFHPHLLKGEPGDKHIHKPLREGLHGHEFRSGPVVSDTGAVFDPVRYGYRSFDRQWIIPDGRLINRPNPTLWKTHSDRQVYMTALHRTVPSAGPAVTFSAAIPDLDHYSGRGGRVFPLWADQETLTPNLKAGLLREMAEAMGYAVEASDMMAYFAAVAAHPAYTARFGPDLVQPGLRLPVTADSSLFAEAVEIGREVVWLHCFGERFADPDAGRPAAPPRMPQGERPVIPREGASPPNRTVSPTASPTSPLFTVSGSATDSWTACRQQSGSTKSRASRCSFNGSVTAAVTVPGRSSGTGASRHRSAISSPMAGSPSTRRS